MPRINSRPGDTEIQALVGERIRSLRVARGWKMWQLADKVNEASGLSWSVDTVSHIEAATGSRRLSLNEASVVARMFDLSIDELIYGDSPRPVKRAPRGRPRIDQLDVESVGVERSRDQQMSIVPAPGQRDRITKLARRAKLSSASLVRTLLEIGLQTLEGASGADLRKVAEHATYRDPKARKPPTPRPAKKAPPPAMPKFQWPTQEQMMEAMPRAPR